MNRPDFAMRLLYVTTKDRNQAMTIGRALVGERLAACVNILDDMLSMYRWKGEIEETRETVMIVKTAEHLVEDATRRVKELHTYEVPCVISLPVESGYGPYMDWIRESL